MTDGTAGTSVHWDDQMGQHYKKNVLQLQNIVCYEHKQQLLYSQFDYKQWNRNYVSKIASFYKNWMHIINLRLCRLIEYDEGSKQLNGV